MADQDDTDEQMAEQTELESICDCCSYGPVETKKYPKMSRWRVGSPEETDDLCILCASSRAGNGFNYPDQYRGQVETMMTICHVGNAIIAAIREASKQPPAFK